MGWSVEWVSDKMSTMAASTSEERKDFFISYNHRDAAWAEWIAWQLEAEGYSTVIQAWDFHAGANFVVKMHDALRGAERTIAVLSPSFFGSTFTSPEWAAVFAGDPEGRRGKLIPVRVDEVALDGLFRSVVCIDLIDKDEVSARAELLKRVRVGRAKPAQQPRFPGTPPSYPGLPPKNNAHSKLSLRVSHYALYGGIITLLALAVAISSTYWGWFQRTSRTTGGISSALRATQSTDARANSTARPSDPAPDSPPRPDDPNEPLYDDGAGSKRTSTSRVRVPVGSELRPLLGLERRYVYFGPKFEKQYWEGYTIVKNVNVDEVNKATGGGLSLDQFTIDTAISGYEETEGGYSAYHEEQWPHLAQIMPPWFAKPEAEEPPVSPVKATDPIFDLTVSSKAAEYALLTGVELLVCFAEPWGGSEQERRPSPIVPVAARYTIRISLGQNEVWLHQLLPPLQVAPNQPTRFQLRLVPAPCKRCELEYMAFSAVLRFRLKFSNQRSLITKQFGVSFSP
jgi:hypothetical protein